MSEIIPPELQEVVVGMAHHIIPGPLPRVTRIPVYCNVCEHPIERYGNEWRCSEKCRCLMMGCVPKVWSEDAD